MMTIENGTYVCQAAPTRVLRVVLVWMETDPNLVHVTDWRRGAAPKHMQNRETPTPALAMHAILQLIQAARYSTAVRRLWGAADCSLLSADWRI